VPQFGNLYGVLALLHSGWRSSAIRVSLSKPVFCMYRQEPVTHSNYPEGLSQMFLKHLSSEHRTRVTPRQREVEE
jgi:hypothetical protein